MLVQLERLFCITCNQLLPVQTSSQQWAGNCGVTASDPGGFAPSPYTTMFAALNTIVLEAQVQRSMFTFQSFSWKFANWSSLAYSAGRHQHIPLRASYTAPQLRTSAPLRYDSYVKSDRLDHMVPAPLSGLPFLQPLLLWQWWLFSRYVIFLNFRR